MTAAQPEDELVTTKVDLLDDGILWMINSTIFHPRGLALAVDEHHQLFLQGDGSEVWIFEEELAEQKFIAFKEMVRKHLER